MHFPLLQCNHGRSMRFEGGGVVDNSLRCICICINILFFICTAQSAQRLILLFSHVMRTHYNCSFNCNCVCVCVCAVFLAFCLKQNAIITLFGIFWTHTIFPFPCSVRFKPVRTVCLCAHSSFFQWTCNFTYSKRITGLSVLRAAPFSDTHWDTSTLHCMPSHAIAMRKFD